MWSSMQQWFGPVVSSKYVQVVITPEVSIIESIHDNLCAYSQAQAVFEISACPVARDKQIFVRTSNFLAIFHYFTLHNLSKHHQGKQVFQTNFEHWAQEKSKII